jgi:glycosyltransferase involved in cell wall biosynthesis
MVRLQKERFASRREIEVFLVGPYGQRGGGMGRSMEYLVEGGHPDFSFKMLESRGSGHAMLSLAFILYAAWRIIYASGARSQSIVHLNVAERGSLLRKGLLIYLSRALGLPSVIHLHAAEMLSFYDTLHPWLRMGLAMTFRSASRVVVLGESNASWILGTLGVEPSRIAVVRNGVADRSGRHNNKPLLGFRFLFLGNLHRRKGVLDLLHALAAPSLKELEWSLTIAGGGDAEAVWLTARCLGIGGRLHMPGWLEADETAAVLACANALVLPSYHEALPLAVLEALSFSVPVITTPVGVLPEVLRDGETALLVAPGDRSGLTNAAHRLLTDPCLAAHIGKAGRLLYEREFTQQGFADRLGAIYRGLVRY